MRARVRADDRRVGESALSTGSDVLALVRLVRPFLLAVMKVQRLAGQGAPAPADVDRELRKLLDQVLAECVNHGASEPQQDHLRFALVVFADEKMQGEPGPLGAYWVKHQWAWDMFGHARGGEVFYERLSALRQQPEELAIVAVYLTCLRLGFYGILGDKEAFRRMQLIEDLEEAVDIEPDGDSWLLSPRGERPEERAYDIRRSRWLFALVIACAVASGAVCLGLWSVLEMQGQDILRGMQR